MRDPTTGALRPLAPDGSDAMIFEYSTTPAEAVVSLLRDRGWTKEFIPFQCIPLRSYTDVGGRTGCNIGIFRVREVMSESDRDALVQEAKALTKNYEPYNLFWTNCESAAFGLANRRSQWHSPEVPMVLWNVGLRFSLHILGAACLCRLASMNSPGESHYSVLGYQGGAAGAVSSTLSRSPANAIATNVVRLFYFLSMGILQNTIGGFEDTDGISDHRLEVAISDDATIVAVSDFSVGMEFQGHNSDDSTHGRRFNFASPQGSSSSSSSRQDLVFHEHGFYLPMPAAHQHDQWMERITVTALFHLCTTVPVALQIIIQLVRAAVHLTEQRDSAALCRGGTGQQQIPGEGAAFVSNTGKGRSGGSQGATPGEQIRPPPSSTSAQREEVSSLNIQQRQIFSKCFHHLLAKEVGRAVTTGVFAVGLLAVLPSLVLSGAIPARSAVPLALFSYNIASMLFGVLCKLAIAFFQTVLGGVPVLTFESVPSKGKMGLSPSHQCGAPGLAVPLSLSAATAAASGIGASLFQRGRK
jgi:hypothetical protein